jgi:hypothetical protein
MSDELRRVINSMDWDLKGHAEDMGRLLRDAREAILAKHYSACALYVAEAIEKVNALRARNTMRDLSGEE